MQRLIVLTASFWVLFAQADFRRPNPVDYIFGVSTSADASSLLDDGFEEWRVAKGHSFSKKNTEEDFWGETSVWRYSDGGLRISVSKELSLNFTDQLETSSCRKERYALFDEIKSTGMLSGATWRRVDVPQGRGWCTSPKLYLTPEGITKVTPGGYCVMFTCYTDSDNQETLNGQYTLIDDSRETSLDTIVRLAKEKKSSKTKAKKVEPKDKFGLKGK